MAYFSVVVLLAILVLLFLLFFILTKCLSLLVEVDDATRSEWVATTKDIASATDVEGVGKRLRAPCRCIVLAWISLDNTALVTLSSSALWSHVAHASPCSDVVALSCSTLERSANVSSVSSRSVCCCSSSLRGSRIAGCSCGLWSFSIFIHNLLLTITPCHRLGRCSSSLLWLDAGCLAVSDELFVNCLLFSEA